jgi:hypothetical protein
MYKSKFTLSDGLEEFEGYTDGSLWNGWSNVCFTKEQVEAFLNTTPYDYRFADTVQENGEKLWTTLYIYWDNGVDSYPSTPLPTDDGDILEGFFLDGLEFMEAE